MTVVMRCFNERPHCDDIINNQWDQRLCDEYSIDTPLRIDPGICAECPNALKNAAVFTRFVQMTPLSQRVFPIGLRNCGQCAACETDSRNLREIVQSCF